MKKNGDGARSAATLREAIVCALVLSWTISTPALSAQTDIWPTPITSSSAAQVKPNITLLMDTFYSMSGQLARGAGAVIRGPVPVPP
jgi:hypothetical protein